jgi:hypothetical protein
MTFLKITAWTITTKNTPLGVDKQETSCSCLVKISTPPLAADSPLHCVSTSKNKTNGMNIRHPVAHPPPLYYKENTPLKKQMSCIYLSVPPDHDRNASA